MRVKKLMMVTALTASLVMSTMTVSAAPQDTQTQSEVEYTTKASESELAAIKKLFNAKEYAAMYPDVAVVYGDNEEALWSHFVNFGLAEGRALRKDFNVFAYRSAYKDLQDVFGTDLAAYYAHYASNGMEEGRSLTTIEKVTKAGIAVTGLQGQILAEPVPAVQTTTAVSAASSSVSASGSSEASAPSENPEPGQEPSKPSEPSNPGQKPSNPDPSKPDPSNQEECTHEVEYKSDDTGHQQICKKCGKELTGIESHTWKYIKVSGEDAHTSVCTLCGYQGQKTACTSTSVAKTSYTQHWWICDDCGEVFDEENHSWSNGICNICRYQCGHDIYDITSIDYNDEYHQWICRRCGLQEKRAHDFKEQSNGVEECADCKYIKSTSN